MQESHIVSALVEDRPGVLHRVSNMFRSRNFNIQSISVGPTEQKGTSRMTITVNGDEPLIEQLVKQLDKLVDVIEVSVLNPKEAVHRELALIKFLTQDSKARSDVVSFTNVYRGRVVDASIDSMTVEITGTPGKVDAFIGLAQSLGVIEISRTGVTALHRGRNSGEKEANNVE